MNEHPRYAWQSIVWLVIAVVSALTLGAVLAFGVSNQTVVHRVDANGTLSIDQAKRTECRSIRSAALDKARWGDVADLLSDQNATPKQVVAAGKALKGLPSIDTLTNKGGTIAGRYFAACPPSIAKRKS